MSSNGDITKMKRIGGWASETQVHPKDLIIPQRSLEKENEIPTIPDIDDIPDSISKESSSLDKMQMNRTVLYQELDSELLKHQTFATFDDVNLSLLLKYVHPDVYLKENDTAWTVDSLFKDLSEYYQDENKRYSTLYPPPREIFPGKF